MEYLDLLDKDRNLIGKKVIRGKKGEKFIPDGYYINIILVFIQNNAGKFLIQKTSKEKESVMATTGGFVKSGDTSIGTVRIEIKEELGIDIKENEYQLFKTFVFDNTPVFFDVYYLRKDIDIKEMTLQKEEVENVYYLSINEIKELIKEDKLRKGNIIPFLELIDSDLVIKNS